MTGRRYTLDIMNPTGEDITWLDRTLKNIADLINAGNKKTDTSAVLIIEPLEEESHEPQS